MHFRDGLAGAGREGVSSGSLMNQCQLSDEKIIKKQAGTVLNAAKGWRPFYCIWMENKGNNGVEKIHIITDAKMPFRWHYEGRQYK